MTGEESPVAVAKVQFDEGRYDDCISSLKALANSSTQLNSKIKHNLAICQHLRKDSDIDLAQFLNILTTRGSGKEGINEEVDEEEESEDNVERGVQLYNTALIYYQMKNYLKAIVLLEKLFKVIEPLEEILAYKICFLLVECYLSAYQPENAAMVVYYLDTHIKSNSDNHTQIEMHKARMHLYKTRLYAQQNCLKACKREIKNVLSVSGTTASSLYLKSEFEYLRGNFKKSSKLLNSSPKSCPSKEHIPTLYYNNFGCLHFKMHKYNLGVFYMSKALEENYKAVKAAPPGSNSTIFTVNHHYQILYNYGVILLHAGQPRAAFECLTQTCAMFADNPRLWLRIAECAINTVKVEEAKSNIQSSKSIAVKAIIGSGIYRKTILNTGFQTKFKKTTAGLLLEGPTPTLTFAALCLRNALELLPPAGVASQTPVSGLPAAPIKNLEILRACILCNLSYVWLGLEDPIQALGPAQEVASQTSAPLSYRLLGHLYMAESLILLNRSSEAMSCLSPETIEQVKETTQFDNAKQSEEYSTNSPPTQMNTSDLCLDDIHNTIILNSVAVLCMRRDLNRAKRVLAQYLSTKNDSEVLPQATMLLVYIELKQGNTSAALCILKQQQQINF